MAAPSTRHQLAQLAYEAYGEQQHWQNYAGLPMPAWEATRPDIREAWVVAIMAVVARLMDEDEIQGAV